MKMKRVVLSFVLFASVIAVSAQPRAIGARGGYGVEASYQHSFGESNMLQLDLGIPFSGIQAVGTYNWLSPIGSGDWNWYAGIGAGVGIYGWGWRSSWLFVGIAGMIGIEYNFNIPLQISLDYRPVIGPYFYDGHVGFNHYGFWYGAAAFSIRYKF
jgi:hypothetical protein